MQQVDNREAVSFCKQRGRASQSQKSRGRVCRVQETSLGNLRGFSSPIIGSYFPVNGTLPRSLAPKHGSVPARARERLTIYRVSLLRHENSCLWVSHRFHLGKERLLTMACLRPILFVGLFYIPKATIGSLELARFRDLNFELRDNVRITGVGHAPVNHEVPNTPNAIKGEQTRRPQFAIEQTGSKWSARGSFRSRGRNQRRNSTFAGKRR